jgi:hypothetical protein
MFADLDQADTALGPGSPPEIMGRRSDLQSVERWATAVLRFWAGNDSTWLPLERRGIVTAEQILHGRVEVRPLLSAVIRAEEQVRVQLTLQQSRVLRALGVRRRAAICGGAGTGKTLLAIEKARELATSGSETLLLCYNRLLADFLGEACRGVDRLTVLSYHQLCVWRSSEAKRLTGRDLLREARQQTLDSSPSAEYDLVMPLALALSCEATPLRFDAIVIDEGQDFKDEYWLGLEWLLRDDAESLLYVFYDQNQALYTRSSSMPITDPPFVLTFNCRNTRYIHESAYRFFQGEVTDYPPGNDGVPIQSLCASTLAEQGRKLHAAVVDLLVKQGLEPSQIAVLVCGEPKETFFRALTGKPVPKGTKWLVEGNIADRGIRLETVKRFKGLEADVVFLWGIDFMPAGDERELLYVAISRAKSRLTLVGTEELCDRVLQNTTHH